MVLLLLTIVRGDLLQGWAKGMPEDAPNRFVINIQTQQVAEIRNFFAQKGMADVELFPMVRGRLTAINGASVSEQRYEDTRARGLAAREFNLSWADRLQVGNTIVQGYWWGDGSKTTNRFPMNFQWKRELQEHWDWHWVDQLT